MIYFDLKKSILPELEVFAKEIEDGLYNLKANCISNKVTVVNPFNLTQQTRKKILLPEEVCFFKFYQFQFYFPVLIKIKMWLSVHFLINLKSQVKVINFT